MVDCRRDKASRRALGPRRTRDRYVTLFIRQGAVDGVEKRGLQGHRIHDYPQ